MAYVMPNTNIKLLKGIPIDADYNNTLYFETEDDQKNFFDLYAEQVGNIVITKNNYIRSTDNSVKVMGNKNDFIDFNYMLFENIRDNGYKRYYAFIDKVEYINEKTTEIFFTVDVMQTWYFEHTIGFTYVEREHSETDEIGENIIPEGIDPGEMICFNKYEVGPIGTADDPLYNYWTFDIWYVPNEKIINYDGLLTSSDFTVTAADKTENDGFYIEHTLFNGGQKISIQGVIDESTQQQAGININKLIIKIIENSGTLVAIYQYPTRYAVEGTTAIPYPTGFDFNNDSFQPVNNKMYTSPYIDILVSNNNGSTNKYSFENFNGNAAKFKTIFSKSPQPASLIYPLNYLGDSGYDKNITCDNFFRNPFSVDTFEKWWSENKSSFTTSQVTSAITAVVAAIGAGIAAAGTGGAAVPVILAAGTSGLAGIANGVATLADRQNAPDSYNTSAYTPVIRFTEKRPLYTIYVRTAKPEIARCIDEFFTMYGYATKRVKIPNIKNPDAKKRPKFNYIKTVNCQIVYKTETTSPAGVDKELAAIYDKGITFWTNYNEVGQYQLNNKPVEV